MGIGFAIPIDMAKRITEQLIENGYVDRGYLGIMIQNMTTSLAASFGLDAPKGILVAEVMQNSPAQAAGLCEGDIILEFNGETAKNVAVFRNKIAAMRPETLLNLLIFRNNREQNIEAVIAAMPGHEASLSRKSSEISEKLGFKVEELSDDHIQRYGYSPGQGLIITEIRHNSLLADAGIQPGNLIISVNREKLQQLKNLKRQSRISNNKISALARN